MAVELLAIDLGKTDGLMAQLVEHRGNDRQRRDYDRGDPENPTEEISIRIDDVPTLWRHFGR